jgi:2-polyprenyl-3-methyl-5-hydroxy-6-metoxy-1,4-benzoquinol methylase
MSKAKLVCKGYNKIARDYFKARDQFKSHKYLEQLNKLLKPNSLILDIGCGAGKPIDEFLADRGHRVIGIDISGKMIEFACRNFPE